MRQRVLPVGEAYVAIDVEETHHRTPVGDAA